MAMAMLMVAVAIMVMVIVTMMVMVELYLCQFGNISQHFNALTFVILDLSVDALEESIPAQGWVSE